MSQKKIVFLYTELAEYVMACFAALEQEDVELHIVHWPVNNEAPFQLRTLAKATMHQRAKLNDGELSRLLCDLLPDVVITSGWMDKGYLSALKALQKKHTFISILALDNHWNGSFKQQLGSIYARLRFIPRFTHAWVPGDPQVVYAQKLGIKIERIITGFYCADTRAFSQFYTHRPERKSALPKRFIYIGRYVAFKGIHDLWEAFSACRQDAGEWELLCLGTGELWESRTTAEGVKHLGFIQPNDLPKYLDEAGVFVLPSHREPWGVVVHEMAAAGFPLICSSAIGAASRFLEEGKNGYTFEPANATDLAEAMKKITQLSDEERAHMGAHSHQLASQLTTRHWVNNLMSLIEFQ